MNIIKGIDRIALVVAIVAIVPGALLGSLFVFETCKTETPEYKAWQEKVEGWFQANPNTGRYHFLSLPYFSEEKEWKEPWPKYKYPPIWQKVLGGVVAAPLSFFIVLFGIRGTTRLVIWFATWLVAGFRD